MENRRRLMKVANALLYFGPLLAGLGGFGWGLVPVFTAIFVLWLVILQPHEFPSNRRDWLAIDTWVGVAARAVVQLLLVIVLFGVGRGIGGMLGFKVGYRPMLPIIISFLSIPLARIIWDPRALPPPPPADQSLAADARAPSAAEPVPAPLMPDAPDASKLSPP